MTCIFRSTTGAVTFVGPSLIEVLLGEETSEQLEATTDDVNSTLVFEIDTVTEGQGDYVTLNSSGYLTIGSGADTSFYIDVSIIQLITQPIASYSYT